MACHALQVKADPGIQKLLKDRYGVTDMALVACDPWYYGDRYGAPELLPLPCMQCSGMCGILHTSLAYCICSDLVVCYD